TFKKAGWDCLRHYEIIANGCLPYFVNLESCPNKTLTALPKALLLEIKAVIDEGAMTDDAYRNYVSQLLEIARNSLTTEHWASYVLRELDDLNHRAPVGQSPKNKATDIEEVGEGYFCKLKGKGSLFVDTMHKS